MTLKHSYRVQRTCEFNNTRWDAFEAVCHNPTLPVIIPFSPFLHSLFFSQEVLRPFSTPLTLTLCPLCLPFLFYIHCFPLRPDLLPHPVSTLLFISLFQHSFVATQLNFLCFFLSSSPYGSNPINAAIMNVQNLIPTFPYRLRIDILLQLQTES